MTEDTLPPLREVIARHGLDARKSLGQNFLLDLNLTRRIARGAGDLADVTVYEVGPGPGGLTRGLLMEGAAHVIAVELDRRAVAAQSDIAAAYPGRLTVIEGDALAMNERELMAGKTAVKVVANLPYNVGTALLVKWLTAEPWPSWFQSLTLMFQREVAERIVAEPRSKEYGRLSVLAQARATAKILFDVPRTAFVPPPKITSSVVHLVPKDWPADGPSIRSLERVTAAAFGQRRKMLRASLKSLGRDPLPLLAAAGLPETARAEEIDVAGFLRLAKALEA
ncbi:16S rRNA (adenine(1518)-N(6)/adenine(1519)-N(6))-dimethyltransferase RsmA [Govanella unica]|uniref:Ribosomal RNA small subunit methyltransferase A n=1 Tax=Govanella unica TaxID=2975056 RepID=A0A9X3TZ08_9PROT|nr:16S rRNA (adenine(1518)-N(6)/adenine(1519)-N(6))-dimethyltransferase RsmA [Govania unica]MDA5194354.1 16S rRNA (adenine(1518)-N(6)/adenine(1519)-N(6))-dimethyltransferase RsmA [Govania unica]